MSPVRGAAAVALLTGALVLAGSAPADAHAYIVASTPAAGSTVEAAPRTVSITFDESILDLGRNAIGVVDPAGRQVATACARVDGATLTVPVALTSGGRYRVVWRASSADGHLVGGDYAFRYRAPAGRAAPAPPSPVPSCAPVGRAAAPRTPGPSAALTIAIVIGGVALLAVLAVVVVAVAVVRRSDREEEREGGGGAESPP